MAEWMNQIGEAIGSQAPRIKKYMDQGVERTTPQREWTDKYAVTPLPPATLYKLKRKPDLILVEKSKSYQKLKWSDILAFSEVTKVLYNPATEPSIKEK